MNNDENALHVAFNLSSSSGLLTNITSIVSKDMSIKGFYFRIYVFRSCPSSSVGLGYIAARLDVCPEFRLMPTLDMLIRDPDWWRAHFDYISEPFRSRLFDDQLFRQDGPIAIIV